jgi:hypothetical protein
VELAMIMDRLYGGVCYAGIDTDPELKYPKVSEARFMTFNNNGKSMYTERESVVEIIIHSYRLLFSYVFAGRWSCGIFESTKLHCSHFRSLRSIATQ